MSRQDVGNFRARLTAKGGVARLLVLEADSLEEANARNVARIGDAEHLLNASGREEEPKYLAHREGCDATALNGWFKREANLGRAFIIGQENVQCLL